MNILLIDKRVQDYETIVAAIDPALAVGVVFDYYEDTFDTVKTRMRELVAVGNSIPIAVCLIQHNYNAPMFTMLASADVAPVAQVAAQDPDLAAWTQFRDFITWCKAEFNAAHFDLMACALYSDPDWKYVIDTLTAQTGVTVRASTDDTGAASLGGDWFLESHTGVNLKTVYFTEAIEEYHGLLLRLSEVGTKYIKTYDFKGIATGSVITWGPPSSFLGIGFGGGGNSSSVSSSIQSDVISIYSAAYAHAALKSDGSVVAWGDTRYGGNYTSVASSLTSGVVSIYSTQRAFAALKSNGSVVPWGDQNYGGEFRSQYSFPSPDILDSGVVAVYSTEAAFAALKSDGSVQAWGNSGGGWLYNYETVAYNLTRSGVVSVYSSQYAFVALKSNGGLVMWGNAGWTIADVSSSISSGVVAVYSTQYAWAALKNDGRVITWADQTFGGNSSVYNNTTNTYTSVASSLTSGFVSLWSNQYAFAALKNDGSVVTWGWGRNGGDSSSVSSSLTSGVVAVYSTATAFAALKNDGSVITWGGDGGNGGNSSSVSSSLTSGVVAIYSTSAAFAALKSNGSIVAWGHNGYGGSFPGWVDNSGFVSIYSTFDAFAALKSNGSVITWGGNGGDSSSVSSSLNSGVIGLTCNRYSFAALKTSASTFDLSGSVYTVMDRYTILRNKESRRRVNLTTLNNNVFTLSSSRDIQVINPNIPAGTTLKIIIPTYVASSYSITSNAVIPNSSGSFIVACDESEPVTISGTTYVNYGAFVYQVNANGTYTKVTSATINGTTYTLYGGDGVFSSGIVFLELILEVSTLSASTFTVAPSKTFGNAPFSFNVLPTSNNTSVPIVYSSRNTNVATVDASGTTITLVGAGDVSFNATQTQTNQYAAATKTSNTLTVSRATSTLSGTFAVPSSKTFGNAPFSFDTLPTSNNSSVAIVYSSRNTNVATVDASGTTITLVGAGDVSFNATQLQTNQYEAPTPVTSNTLTVSKVTPTLVFVSPPTTKSVTDLAFTVTATSGILFSVSNSGSGAYVINSSSNPTLTVIRGMRYILSVNASGHPFWIQTVSGAYSSGNIYSNSSIVNNGEDVGTIVWEVALDTPNTLYYACQFHSSMQGTINVADGIGPTGASSGAVTYTSSNTDRATVGLTTGLVTLLDTGSVTITADQAASARYNAPTNTTFTMTIGAAANLTGQTVTTSLARKNLTGISLVGTNLANISLANTNLRNADLSGAVVTGASFINTDISGATNLPVFSTTQKLQLMRNANNAAISAVQISTPLSGAEINAAITTPIPDISGATFVVKAPAYNVNNEKVVTVTAEDMANDESLYIPMNSGETVKVNGVAYTFNGTNILNSSGSVIRFINVLGKPFRLYAGSIIGLNVADQLNNIKLNGDGLYDILTGLFAAKS
jgi:uncharacterized protein YjbI with pentapeptide repeats/uncharacterized glyoxalase superfamily protein PhnB